MAERLLLQPVNPGMIREELMHGPTVRHALKQGKIAEVSVGEQPVQSFQFFGEIIQLLGELLNPPANHPVDAFGPAPLLQRKIAEAKEIEG